MIVSWRNFSGVVPRLPPHRLPLGSAQYARNCDFARGDLKAYRTPFKIVTVGEAVRGIYTADGLTFITWPYAVDAMRGPVVEDSFRRVYYTTENGDGLRVTFADQARVSGGQPSSKYKAGCNGPTAKPTLTPVTHDPGSLLSATFFFEAGGVKYQEAAIGLSVVEAGKKYRFTPPAKDVYSEAGTGTTTSEAIQITGYYATADGGIIPLGSTVGIQVTSPSSIRRIDNSQTIQAYKIVDTLGAEHFVATMFSLVTYTYVDSGGATVIGESAPNSSQTPAGKTPDNAFPAVHVTATLPAEGNRPLFDVYSVGSTFQVGLPSAKITLAEDPNDATAMLLTVEFEQGSSALVEDRAYIYTYVNSLNEESAPSPPAVTTVSIFQKVMLTLVAPANTDGRAPVTRYRVYRTATGANGQTEYFKVGDGQVADGAAYADIVKTSELSSDLCESWDWDVPPDDLIGLAYIGNGMLAGISGTDFRVSEPFRPHAWPAKYGIPFPSRPVRIMPSGNTVLVTTTGYPYIITGSSPEGLVQTRLASDAPAVSRDAHANLRGVIAYASTDGIVLVNGGVASMEQSLALFGREAWRELYGTVLSSMRFAAHDGQLVISAADNAAIIRFDEAAGTMTYNDLGPGGGEWRGMFVLPETDSLYVSYDRDIYKFAGSDDGALIWHSGDVELQKPSNMGALQLLGHGTFTIVIIADGGAVFSGTFSVEDERIVRLPTWPIARRWSVYLDGYGEVETVHLANTVAEFRGA